MDVPGPPVCRVYPEMIKGWYRSPPLIGYFITFILTGELATGGFNRSTVVAVQDVVRKVFWVVFWPHYNTTVESSMTQFLDILKNGIWKIIMICLLGPINSLELQLKDLRIHLYSLFLLTFVLSVLKIKIVPNSVCWIYNSLCTVQIRIFRQVVIKV